MNSVAPGIMYTPLLEKLGDSESAEDHEIQEVHDRSVLQGHMDDAFDVTNCVAIWLVMVHGVIQAVNTEV